MFGNQQNNFGYSNQQQHGYGRNGNNGNASGQQYGGNNQQNNSGYNNQRQGYPSVQQQQQQGGYGYQQQQQQQFNNAMSAPPQQQQQQFQQPQQPPNSAQIILEHALGYTARTNAITFVGSSNGNSNTRIAYPCGKAVIVNDLDDPHAQVILRGFSSAVTCLDYGRLHAASAGVVAPSANGQQQEYVDVIVTGHAANASDGVCNICFWNVGTGLLIKAVPTVHKFSVTAVTNQNSGNAPIGGGFIAAVKFSPDGLLVAVTGSDGSVSVMECAGGSRIAFFKDTIPNDEANAIVWGATVANAGTRDQRYTFAVPFTTGVRLFTLQFNVKSLAYELSVKACNTPGGGGRTGGFQRRFLSVAQMRGGGPNDDEILCGCSTGEVLVFNVTSGNFRACLQVCHGAITSIVGSSAPAYRNNNNQQQQQTPLSSAFVCSTDGAVKQLIGRDSEWDIAAEVTLPGSKHAPTFAAASMMGGGGGVPLLHQTRCVGMAISSAAHSAPSSSSYSSSPSSYGPPEQIVVATTSGIIYRLLSHDLSMFTSAAEGPIRSVTAIAVKDTENNNPHDSSSSSSSALLAARIPISSLAATCSADGAVRLWSLDDYQTIATFFADHPHSESCAANPPNFPSSSALGGGGVGAASMGGGRGGGGGGGAAITGRRAGNTNNNGNANTNTNFGASGAAFGTTFNTQTVGGRTLNNRFGNNDGAMSASGAVAHLGNNSYQTSSGTMTLNGGNSGGGGNSVADPALVAVPLCAVFDKHHSSSVGGGSDGNGAFVYGDALNSVVLLTGWSDGHVRAIDFTECVKHFYGNKKSSALSPQPTLCYELAKAHRGPISAIDCCNEFLVTGGGGAQDAAVRVWSNPPPLAPSEIQHLQNNLFAVNNSRQLPFLATNHHQHRVVVTEINAHAAPITGVRVDTVGVSGGGGAFLLHTCSADMTHKVFDLSASATASHTQNANAQSSAAHRHGGNNVNNASSTGYANNRTMPGGFGGVPAAGRNGLSTAVVSQQQPPKLVRSHESTHCSGFLCLSQRCDSQHEIIVGTGDGQILFFDMDVPTRAVAALQAAQYAASSSSASNASGGGVGGVMNMMNQRGGNVNGRTLAGPAPRHPITAIDVWNGSQQRNGNGAGERFAVGLGDGSVVVFGLFSPAPNTNTTMMLNSSNNNGGPAFGRRAGGGGGFNNSMNGGGGGGGFGSSPSSSSVPSAEAAQGVTLLAVHTAMAGCGSSVTSLKWSPDGKQLITAGSQGEVYIWDYFAASQ